MSMHLIPLKFHKITWLLSKSLRCFGRINLHCTQDMSNWLFSSSPQKTSSSAANERIANQQNAVSNGSATFFHFGFFIFLIWSRYRDLLRAGNGSRFEARWGQDIFSSSHPSRPSLESSGHSISFPVVNRRRREVDHSPPSSAELKNE